MKTTKAILFSLILFSLILSHCISTDKELILNPDQIIKKNIPNKTDFIFGVTIDSIDNLPEIINSLKSFKIKPTSRIVFDENQPASYYKNAITKISAVSSIMGEILDSFYVKNYSATTYSARTSEYLNLFGALIDIWEIGNEVNGEWLGETSTVVAKINKAYDLIKAKGKKTALTLYYNENCWENQSNEMFTWTQKNISPDMKQNLDYVWLSYYEDDCNNLQPDWPTVFEKLGKIFPHSKIGFGEVGTKFVNRKASYIKRYYNMKIDHPRYVGGYFWWYFNEDMVPATKSLWSVLNTAIIR